VCFSRDDLELFSVASRDRNPLHLSEAYARRSPFGEPVVFGVLGALACLGRSSPRAGRLESAVLEFPNPMLVGVPYTLQVSEDSPERLAVRLVDGRRLLVRLTARFGAAAEGGALATEGPSPDEEAADLRSEELVAGLTDSNPYRPDRAALEALIARLGLAGHGVEPVQVAALLACSYLIGMRLPGRRALFSRLALRFRPPGDAGTGSLEYAARVTGLDRRFELLSLTAELKLGGAALAQADLQAFVRQDVPADERGELQALLPAGESRRGRVALVVGASRGLGAAIAHALALQGCTVLAGYRRGREEAEALRARAAGAPGEVLPLEGDAGDAAWCEEARARILAQHGRLDLLVCSACPPLLPLWLEPGAAPRIVEHVSRSVALAATPMAALLDCVADQAGWCVLISSSAVQSPVPEWPHYVAAKLALEGLARVGALEHPRASFLIARPPRLLTDLTNTPLGRQAALAPARVAAVLARRLAGEPAPGRVELLEEQCFAPEVASPC